MAGSEADKQPDEGAESSVRVERPSLADFLKPPPRSKSSMPPPPETVTVANVPPPSPTKSLSDLFSEAPVPRSRRRSSLIPNPPSEPSATPAFADEDRNADQHRDAEEDRDVDEGGAVDEDREIDEDDDAQDDDAADDSEAGESSIDEDIEDADAALSVPPPLLSPAVARRAAIAVGAVLVAVALFAGARKFQTRAGGAPAASVSSPAPSAEAPLPSVPSADLDPDPDDLGEELPVDEAKGLALRREARAMLEAGRIDEGVATARRAIEANPGDPETYILLAAGLQDQGKWDEARQIFSKCVRQSTRAERSECVYFATRGK